MDEVVKPEAIPALYEHAARVYTEMLRVAIASNELGDEVSGPVWMYEGHLTQLFKKLRLSVPYYTLIKNRLAAMGCIEQIKRGGGSAESKWVLWKEPTLTDWQEAAGEAPRARGDRYAALEQRFRDLTRLCEGLALRVDFLERELETLRTIVERYNGHNV